MTNDMTYEPFARADCEYSADTFGLHPGVAGVYMEHMADVFCETCARDMLTDELMSRIKEGNPGYEHDFTEEYGNIAAVLSSEEWDCPGARCGHCAIKLNVRVIHYDAVCQPDTCPNIDTDDV
jgi:hypothetical protein